MKNVLAVCMAIYCCGANAQTEIQPVTHSYKYAVKAYASGLFTPYNNESYNWRPNAESYDYVHPSAAVMIQTKRGNYHELELSELDFRHTGMTRRINDPGFGYFNQAGYRLSDTRIALRYEYIIPLVKRTDARLVPSLGWAAMPYFYRFAQMPYLTSDFPITTTTLGVKSFIIPRLMVSITKRVFIDANVPLCLLDMGTIKQHIGNPTLPARAQDYRLADVQFLPRYFTARLGLGVKL